VCHTLDLLRCSPRRNPVDEYEDEIGRDAAQSISEIAESLLIATGNRVIFSVTSRGPREYQEETFVQCSCDPRFCLEKIAAVLGTPTECKPRVTFKTSRYLELYGLLDDPKVEPLEYDDEVWPVARKLVAVRLNSDPYASLPQGEKKQFGEKFFKALKEDWKEAVTKEKTTAFGEELGDAQTVAVRLWSSAKRITGIGSERELCSFINEAIRDDREDMMEPVVQFSRLMNTFLVNRRESGKKLHIELFDKLETPPEKSNMQAAIERHFRLERPHASFIFAKWDYRVMYRGGGIDPNLKRFFEKGRKYRAPAFLSTSFSEEKAQAFIEMVKPPLQCVKWHVHVPLKAATNANFIEQKSNVKGEYEFLFVPYSVFTVLEATWQESPNAMFPHEMHILASEDNKHEKNDLPSSPWT